MNKNVYLHAYNYITPTQNIQVTIGASGMYIYQLCMVNLQRSILYPMYPMVNVNRSVRSTTSPYSIMMIELVN